MKRHRFQSIVLLMLVGFIILKSYFGILQPQFLEAASIQKNIHDLQHIIDSKQSNPIGPDTPSSSIHEDPRRHPLSASQITSVISVIQQLCIRHHLTLERCEQSDRIITENGHVVPLHIQCAGPFDEFHDFLKAVGSLDFIHTLKELSITNQYNGTVGAQLTIDIQIHSDETADTPAIIKGKQ